MARVDVARDESGDDAYILDLHPELLAAEFQGPGDALKVVDEHAGRDMEQ